jgi:hypothetical protein
VAEELGPGGQLGVEPGTTKKVGEETIPQVEGKVFVDAAKDGDEVVLESADGVFGSIAVVHARRGELEVNVFIAKELF